MKSSIRLLALAFTIVLLITTNTHGQYTVVHDFAGGASDGAAPKGSFTLSGSTLYGMATSGGSNGVGIVFKINTNGTGFLVLHSFGDPYDGYWPSGSLIMSGATLYGMTPYGGSNNVGVIFRMNTDGSDYSVLHHFVGGGSDGSRPGGSLLLLGSTLYGMTSGGGSYSFGTIFKINIDGSGFGILRSFGGYYTNDGSVPNGSLIHSGGSLYGLATGGACGGATIFKINTNGTDFVILRSLGDTDGLNPRGDLILQDSVLYGMASGDCGGGIGTVFKISTDGTEFQVLHAFSGGANDGSLPHGSLTLSGSTLYGMTTDGGDTSIVKVGTAFQIETNGSGFVLLHRFIDGVGKQPYGDLTLVGSDLYGMTQQGGSGNHGVIFSLTPPPPYPLWQLQQFGCTNCFQAGEAADPDGDGQNNLAEFLAGTTPTNSASCFHVVSTEFTSNNTLVTWACGGGRTNVLQAASSLSGGYTNISPNITLSGNGDTTTNYLDFGGATNTPTRLYRVRLVMP